MRLYWSKETQEVVNTTNFQLPPPISGRKDNILEVKWSLVSGLLHVDHLLRLLPEGQKFGE